MRFDTQRWELSVAAVETPEEPRLEPDAGALHVLVTGGAGYIGSHATMMLLELGHAVTVVDDLSRGNLGAVRVLKSLAPPKKLRFVEGDVGDVTVLQKALPTVDLVVHFAAVAFVGESTRDPLRYYLNITGNTVRLLHAMSKFNVDRMIYSSTCAVYGNPTQMPITEESPTKPLSPYGFAKLASETAIRDYARSNPKFHAVLLRYFNVYGADPRGLLGEYPPVALRAQGRISTACFDAALGFVDELVVHGTDLPTRDGTCVRDYIHVVDLVRAHLAAIHAASNEVPVYNVGTGRGVSVREFVEACKAVTGKPLNIREEAESRSGDPAEVFADPLKINRELNWTAHFTNVTEGLATGWRWREKHPHGYAVSDVGELSNGSRGDAHVLRRAGTL